MLDDDFSTVHSCRCADRISVCAVSGLDYDFMAAEMLLFFFFTLLQRVIVTEQIGPMS